MDDRADQPLLLRQVEADQPSVRERASQHALDCRLDVPEHLELAVEELREEHREPVVGGGRAGELLAEVDALGVGVRPVLDAAQAP